MKKFKYNPPTEELKALWEKSKTDPIAAYEFCAQINNQFADQLRATAHKHFKKGSFWVKRKHLTWRWPFFYTTDHLAVYPAYRQFTREFTEAAQAVDTIAAIMRQMKMNVENSKESDLFPQDIEAGDFLYARRWTKYIGDLEMREREYHSEFKWLKVNHVYKEDGIIRVIKIDGYEFDPKTEYMFAPTPINENIGEMTNGARGIQIDWETKLDEVD